MNEALKQTELSHEVAQMNNTLFALSMELDSGRFTNDQVISLERALKSANAVLQKELEQI